jgi:NAD+ synthase (glutamine-hydrolysing)
VKICLAQLNYRIGDFAGNQQKILTAIQEARLAGAELIVFSELAICGYPPEDLLDYDWFIDACENAVAEISTQAQGITVVIGGIQRNPGKGRKLFNTAFVIQEGKVQVQHKTLLPTYDVFNELRYFEPANHYRLFEIGDIKFGVLICEDLWESFNDFTYSESALKELKKLQPDLLLNPAASPFHAGKDEVRIQVLTHAAEYLGVPVLNVNQLGAHTELIFDGSSIAVDVHGNLPCRMPDFKEALVYLDYQSRQIALSHPEKHLYQQTDGIDELYRALLFGIQEYFDKMGFRKAVLGSSGGIDSAVVQALATAALGAENVCALLMPSAFSSEGSVNDALLLSKNLRNVHHIIPIENGYEAIQQMLVSHFAGTVFGVAEENLQARIRGILLMAWSNKFGDILLNTSNKSEMAVGYSTLYGDMCGGLSVLGDVYKTRVYELAEHINRVQGNVIPVEILTKAPSAELRPGQKDIDSLPPYDVLDPLLTGYIEQRKSKRALIAAGFDADMVERIVNLVNRNEYKRFQAPPILRVSPKSFGGGRRMPLVARYD